MQSKTEVSVLESRVIKGLVQFPVSTFARARIWLGVKRTMREGLRGSEVLQAKHTGITSLRSGTTSPHTLTPRVPALAIIELGGLKLSTITLGCKTH